MRSLKIIKSVILIVLVFGLIVGCSSTPTNVSKDVYKEISKIQNLVDECFNDEKCNYFEVDEIVNNKLLSINPKTEEENILLLNSINLLTGLVLYKTEYKEHEIMKLELDYKKNHNKVSEQLNKNNQYLD